MGSLRDFTLLTTLTISCLCLLGDPSADDDGPQDCAKFFNLLPSSLVNLSIEIRRSWDIRRFLHAVGGENISRWKRVRGEQLLYLETFILKSDLPYSPSELEALGIGIHMPRDTIRETLILAGF